MQLMQGDESDIRRINPESGAVLERGGCLGMMHPRRAPDAGDAWR